MASAARGGASRGDGERVLRDPGPTAVTPLFSMVVRQVL